MGNTLSLPAATATATSYITQQSNTSEVVMVGALGMGIEVKT